MKRSQVDPEGGASAVKRLRRGGAQTTNLHGNASSSAEEKPLKSEALECQPEEIFVKEEPADSCTDTKEIQTALEEQDLESENFSNGISMAVHEEWTAENVEFQKEEMDATNLSVSTLMRAFKAKKYEDPSTDGASSSTLVPRPSELVATASVVPLPPLAIAFLSTSAVADLVFSSEDEDGDIGPNSALPPRQAAKNVADIPGETGGGNIIGARRLIQPLLKRPKIPWKKSGEEHSLCPMDFKPRNPGIQVDIPDEFDEVDALMLFMPDDIWETIATETTRYYKQRCLAKGVPASKSDVSPGEARAFTGIMLLLGLNPPHSIRTPWKRDSTFRNDIISSTMTFNRFIHISDNFHLVDNTTLPPADTVAYKSARIAPLFTTLQERCRSVYKAQTRQLAIAEGSMGWKGHSAMRHYNPNKPHKYDIKFYKLAETKTGYLSNVLLHDTTSCTLDEVVLTLLKDSPYQLHEGYAIFTDRFYTSPDLFWHLRTVDGFDATGTCMQNRHQFPTELKCAENKLKKGEVRSYTARKGAASMVAMKWKDAKDVFMISTECDAQLMECDVKRGRTRAMKPAMVPLYNKHMGGVDLNDYLETKYSPCRASRKLWKKLTMYLISTAVTNAYIIFRMVCESRNKKTGRSFHFMYRETLGNKLIMANDRRPPRNVSRALQPSAPTGIWHVPKAHPPYEQEVVKARAENREARRSQRKCQMTGCSLKTVFYCQECNLSLCMRPGRMCFSDYHQNLLLLTVPAKEGLARRETAPTVLEGTDTSLVTSEDATEPAPRRLLPKNAAKRREPEPAAHSQSGTWKCAWLSGGQQ